MGELGEDLQLSVVVVGAILAASTGIGWGKCGYDEVYCSALMLSTLLARVSPPGSICSLVELLGPIIPPINRFQLGFRVDQIALKGWGTLF